MNVFLLINGFDEAGGTEEPLTVLAVELKKRGHGVVVLSGQPVVPRNQYVRRLAERHIQVVGIPALIMRLAGDWEFQDRFVRLIARASAVVLWPAALALAVFRRQSLTSCWRSISGGWQRILGAIIHRDRRDAVIVTALRGLAWRRRPDVVHVFLSGLSGALSWAKSNGVASIYYELCVPGEFFAPEAWIARSRELNQATLVTALSNAAAESLKEIVGIQRPIVVVRPVIPDIPETIPSSATRGDQVTIACVGRLSPVKGHDDLLAAARTVVKSCRSARFLIAGGGELLDHLIRLAREFGLSEQVSFTGYFPRSRLAEIMAQTDIFVLPSLSEGMGYVIVEAMAYGKPVVATRVGGIPEVVEHGKTGLLVSPGQPARLAEALLILVNDKTLRLQMGQAGRQRIIDAGFTTESFVSRNLLAYQRALELNLESRGAGR